MVWTATLLANVGAWMASVGTAWLMTVLDPSPIMVSLVGAATALPSFLFALPAGALADIVDRRKLLIIAQVFMLVVMLVLCLLTVAKLITPITLLLLIFVLETGSAFETPAFLAVLPELVPKRQLAPALALNGLGINISRVIGPAVGGLVISALGVSAAFAIDAAAFLAVQLAVGAAREPSAGGAAHRRDAQRMAVCARVPRAQGHAGARGPVFPVCKLLLGPAAPDRPRSARGRGERLWHPVRLRRRRRGCGCAGAALCPRPRIAGSAGARRRPGDRGGDRRARPRADDDRRGADRAGHRRRLAPSCRASWWRRRSPCRHGSRRADWRSPRWCSTAR
jgi:Transmembrane secretion effector